MLDWTAGPFLAFYLATIAVSLLAAYKIPNLLTSVPARAQRSTRFTTVELALIAGGTARAADVLILEKIAAGQASVTGRSVEVQGVRCSRGELARDLSGTLEVLRERLAAEGLALSARRDLVFRLITFGVMAPVILLGFEKMAVGLSRDKPVGILVILLLVTAVIAVVMASMRCPVSAAGRHLLAAYRTENDRAIRAPRPEEVIAAFAVVGVSALTGTALQDYAGVIKPANSGDSGGGCGGGGCGGGGGGGGGGCGGCGSD